MFLTRVTVTCSNTASILLLKYSILNNNWKILKLINTSICHFGWKFQTHFAAAENYTMRKKTIFFCFEKEQMKREMAFYFNSILEYFVRLLVSCWSLAITFVLSYYIYLKFSPREEKINKGNFIISQDYQNLIYHFALILNLTEILVSSKLEPVFLTQPYIFFFIILNFVLFLLLLCN